MLQQERTALRQAHQEAAEAMREGPHQGPIELGPVLVRSEPSNTESGNLIVCNQKAGCAANTVLLTGTPGLGSAVAATHSRIAEFKISCY